MDIRLIPQHHWRFTEEHLPSGAPRCHSSEALSHSIAHKQTRSILDAGSFYPGKFLKTRLVANVPAFFLISCGAPGYTIIPVAANERLYIIDDEEGGKPPGLDEKTIRQLINRGIWPIHSHSRAIKEAINAGVSVKKRQKPYQHHDYHFIESHDCLARCSLPNTQNERHKTFINNSVKSALCDLVLSHPAQFKRYVTEGVYYSGCHQSSQRDKKPQPCESVSCSYCYKSTDFNADQLTYFRERQMDLLNVWQETEYYLGKRNLHETDCPNSNYRGEPLVQVKNTLGRILDTRMYYLATPLQPAKPAESCIYTRVCIINPENRQPSLIIPHDEMVEIIHNRRIIRVGDKLTETIKCLSITLDMCNQRLTESTEEYQQLYYSSKLHRAVEVYKSLLGKLPTPLTERQQAVFNFLGNAELKFALLYALYHQLIKLFQSLSHYQLASDRGQHRSIAEQKPGSDTLALRFVLQTQIKQLVSAHQDTVADIISGGKTPILSGCSGFDIAMLPTLFPFEWLWEDDHRYRQVFEAANDILAFLDELYLLDNENYLMILPEITSNVV